MKQSGSALKTLAPTKTVRPGHSGRGFFFALFPRRRRAGAGDRHGLRAAATKDAEHPAGQDVVYWIAPENGAKKSETPHVFHLCAAVSPLKDKTVNSGSVTEAYAQNATRITKQIEMEQKQCGFSVSQ